MSGTFFLVTFPSEPYHYNWVCFNILNSEWVQLLAYRRCLINICGIRAGYDSELSPALRPPPVRAGCISGYDSDPSPPSPPPVQVGCITGSGLNSPISSQHPTVRHRKTFMKSPCDHGISLHSSLCYLSNSLWIKKKKKKGEQDPGHYLRGIHSTAYCVPGSWDPTGPCSGHPEPWACLLVMPGGASLCTHIKGSVPPRLELPVLAHLSTCPSWAHRRPSSQALALAGVWPATSARDIWVSLSWSFLLSSREQALHWLGLCSQSCTGFAWSATNSIFSISPVIFNVQFCRSRGFSGVCAVHMRTSAPPPASLRCQRAWDHHCPWTRESNEWTNRARGKL